MMDSIHQQDIPWYTMQKTHLENLFRAYHYPFNQ